MFGCFAFGFISIVTILYTLVWLMRWFYIYEFGFVRWAAQQESGPNVPHVVFKERVMLLSVSPVFWVMGGGLIGTWAKTMWRWTKFGVWTIMVSCIMVRHQPHETSRHCGPSQWLQVPGWDSASGYSSSLLFLLSCSVFEYLLSFFLPLSPTLWDTNWTAQLKVTLLRYFLFLFLINMLLFCYRF